LDSYQKQVKFSGADGQTTDKINQEILDGLIDRLIIEQQADKLSITVTETMLDEQIETITTEQGHAYLESWLADNGLSYEDFADRLRFELIANQLFEQITQDTPEDKDTIRPLVDELQQKQQIFIDWLSQQRKSAIIERYQ
jgi:hypothetical protein